MKTILALTITICSSWVALGDGAANEVIARYPYKLATYMGQEGSGVSVSSISTNLETITTNAVCSNIGTTPGNEYELRWVFSQRLGQKDVYRFTYSHPATGTNLGKTTQAKDVHFDGTRVVVFKDERRMTVMTTPTAEDLKQTAPAKAATK